MKNWFRDITHRFVVFCDYYASLLMLMLCFFYFVFDFVWTRRRARSALSIRVSFATAKIIFSLRCTLQPEYYKNIETIDCFAYNYVLDTS